MHIGMLCLVTALAATPGPVGSVSERSFLDAALRDARVRAVLDEPLAAARAQRARAGTLANPEASFDREAPEGLPRQDSWNVSWVPPLDGRFWLRRRAGRAAFEAAEHRHALSELELRAELREAFARWALAGDGAALGRHLAGLVDRLHRRAEAQGARGETSALSARRLLLVRVEIRAEAARLEAELAGARAAIRAWAPKLAAEAAPERPPLPPLPPDTTAWSRSPQVAALEADVRHAESVTSLAGRLWALPELSLGRQTLRDGTRDVGGAVFGVRWGLPLFDRGQGDRIEARGRLAAARARRELGQARAREGFAAARAAYATHREAASLSADAEAAAARVLASAVAIFEAGESDVTDLLETLRGVLGGQRAALDAYAAALRAHRDLERAAGRALPLREGGE